MKSGIYKIRNLVDNKVYVGSAKIFDKRFKRHRKDMLNGHWNIKLRRAINKHGINNFVFEIVEEVEYKKDLILEKENYYISLYNSKKDGYNIGDASFGDVLSDHPNKSAIIEKFLKVLKRAY